MIAKSDGVSQNENSERMTGNPEAALKMEFCLIWRLAAREAALRKII
jgi:hypothetical protein